VVQEPKYAEELVGILYIKPHAVMANEENDLTLGASAPDPNHRRMVGTRRCREREDRSLLLFTPQESGGRPEFVEGDVLHQDKRR
jgi:hypothetical protein